MRGLDVGAEHVEGGGAGAAVLDEHGEGHLWGVIGGVAREPGVGLAALDANLGGAGLSRRRHDAVEADRVAIGETHLCFVVDVRRQGG